MRRKILYIVSFILCFSCKQYAPKAEDSMVKEEVIAAEEGWTNDADLKSGYLETSEITLEVSEKLQAKYEAQILATKHPEFREAIKEQLADSNKFHTALSDSIQTIEIRNLALYGDEEKVNDSISHQKIKYTALMNAKHQQQDSALVIIKRTTVVIDGIAKVNTSFSFESLDVDR